jgi:oligopeptidase B
MTTRRFAAVLSLAGFAWISLSSARAETPDPPWAQSRPHEVTTPFGAVRNDEYFWLRDDTRKDPEMLAYLGAENAYADRVMAAIAPLETRLRGELKDRLPREESSPPYLKRGYWYQTRYGEGQEYPVLARRKGNMSAAEEVLLNEPEMAPKSGYFYVGNSVVSPDNRLLAWTEDHVGRLQYELHIKNIKTGRVYADTVSGISPGIAWGADSRTIIYVVNNKELRPEWLKAHVLGTTTAADPLIFDEKDDTFYTWIQHTNDDKYVCLDGFSIVASEWRCAAVATPTKFEVLVPRERGHMYDVDHANGRWYVRTNWNAANYKLVWFYDNERASGRSAWHDLVPASKTVLIEGMKAFSDFLAVEERFEANKRIRLLSKQGKTLEVAPDDPAFTMALSPEQDFRSRWVRFTYESPSTPTSTREVNFDSSKQRVLQDKRLQGYDPRQYTTERVWVTGRDGARIPVSLMHRKDWHKDGQGALLQYAYGAYDYAVDPKFFDYAVSLADRGMVFAIAHVRGGNELGRDWYDQGHLLQKMNTFNDFVDVTRGLVAQGYANRDRVAALGGSGGGTLMGGIANMAPQDYRVILAIVPFVDALTTMLDPSIPLVTREYDEWGNPNRKNEYDYMLKWSPYDNVRRQGYPALFVYTGLWDSQVQYYEPAKWVARLRANKTDDHPLVFRINMQGGHGGASGRLQKVDSQAEYLGFALSQLGFTQ